MPHSWTNRSCLVTGGAGFGGSHLCMSLLDKGAKVFVLDRIFSRHSFLILQRIDCDVDFIQGDIRDLHFVRVLIERYGFDVIFHLAAQPLVAPSNVVPLETLDINVAGTYNLLEAMRTTQACKSMVFASSGGHYGATTEDAAICEDQLPAAAANIYGASKSAADTIARAYSQIFDLNVVACRFMNTYGPGDLNFSRIIPRAIRNLLLNSDYAFGNRDDGSTRLDYLFIRDMTEAYLAAAEHIAEVRGQAFNFGSGVARSTSEVARMVSVVFDGEERQPVFSGAPRAKPIVKYLNITKAENRLNWKPQTSFEQGLSETVDWYKKIGAVL